MQYLRADLQPQTLGRDIAAAFPTQRRCGKTVVWNAPLPLEGAQLIGSTLTSLSLDNFKGPARFRYYRELLASSSYYRELLASSDRASFMYAHHYATQGTSVPFGVTAAIKSLEKPTSLILKHTGTGSQSAFVLPALSRLAHLRLSLPLELWTDLPTLFPQLTYLDVSAIVFLDGTASLLRGIRLCPHLRELVLSDEQYNSLTAQKLPATLAPMRAQVSFTQK